MLEHEKRIPAIIKLQFPSGHEINVSFQKSEHSLYNLTVFFKQISKISGSIIVFSYKVEGKFLVHVLNDDASEVQYLPLRTNPMGMVYEQGKYNQWTMM